MLETKSFAAAVPGVVISAALEAPMTFGARHTTGTATVMETASGTYDPVRQITVADGGTPMAHQAALRTPYNTTYDSQTFTDREA